MTQHEGVLSYWVPYCFLRVVKYQQGQCFTSKEPVEVVFASTHRALAERVKQLEHELSESLSKVEDLERELGHEREYVQGAHDRHEQLNEQVTLLQHELADAQARLADLHADETGHLHRCAKINGVWSCDARCRMPQHAALREALECALYALEHPASNQEFAIDVICQALATGEEGST